MTEQEKSRIMIRRLRWLCAPVALLLAGPVFAQRLEVGGFTGSRWGGSVDVSNVAVDKLSIPSSVNYGLFVDVGITDNAQFDFMWNRQASRLRQRDRLTRVQSTVFDLNNDNYQFSLLYQFGEAERRIKPFVVAGLGFSHLAPSGSQESTTRFSYNFGAGIKAFFTKHIGARAEVRYAPFYVRDTPTLFCDIFGFCFVVDAAEYANQGQFNAGIVVRF